MIDKIQIFDRKQSNEIYFDNQRRKSNLGYIVKNEFILDSLYKKLEKQKNVQIFNNISPKDIFYVNPSDYEGIMVRPKGDSVLLNKNSKPFTFPTLASSLIVFSEPS